MDVPEYDLPEQAIAQVPVEPRDAARLLVALGPEVEHAQVADLPEFLGPGDLLVVNSSRVVPARLLLRKATGGAAEVLLLEPRARAAGHVGGSGPARPQAGSGNGAVCRYRAAATGARSRRPPGPKEPGWSELWSTT